MDRQDMRGFGRGWSGNSQLFWGAPAPVEKPIRNWPHLSVSFNAATAGTYDILLHYTAAPDFATFRVFIDGKPVADIDGYAPAVAAKERSLGAHKLNAGTHELMVTVFGKSRLSKNFFVGLDRLELKRLETTPVTLVPNLENLRRRRPESGDKPSPSTVQPIKPEVLTRAVCAASPETCCPSGVTVTDGCRLVTEALLEIRIRSYVPPRFTVMGRNSPWDTDFDLVNIVSDVTVDGPYKVWPGCRFNATAARNKVEDSKNFIQKAGELFEAWLGQWSGGVESAKTYVSAGVSDKVCDVVDDSDSCRKHVAAAVKTGINLGLASLGIPPEIPNVQQLREQGIRYLAAQAASYALSDPSVIDKLPVDEQTRELLYQQAYDKALDVLSKELNKAIPSPNFSSQNPGTWGHLEPAYAPHNAHVYVEVRIKPGAYSKYAHLLAVKPDHKWAPLYLHDLNHAFTSMGPIEVPTFIPPDGVILPIELKPYEVAYTKEDTVAAQIPGIKISRAWLEQKVGISAADGLVRGQINYEAATGAGNYHNSDWDLFYDGIKYVKANEIRRSKFRLLMPVGKGVLDWEKDWDAIVATVRDIDVGYTVMLKSGKLQNYYGRINPAPRCDGKPNVEAYPK